MSSVNKVILVGRLGADPEVKTFSNGGRIVNLRVATSEKWKDKQSGERKERTEWHQVGISNEALGKIAEQYLRKGSNVYLSGQIQTRKWQDQNGQDRFSTEVVIPPYRGELVLLDGPGGSNNTGSAPAGGRGNPANDMDDEIPFRMEWR